jgi:hypothetical protein
MNYKIVSKNTGATYFLNEKEYKTFLSKNKMYIDGWFKYEIYNLTKEKARRRNKMLDVVAYLCIIGVSILGTLLYIQNYC